MKTPPEVTLATVADLHPDPDAGAATVPVEVNMHWSGVDPLAMTLAFHTWAGWVEWFIAVELIRDALLSSRPVGEGDVRMERLDEHDLRIELSSPTGCAVFAFDTKAATDFLEDVDAECQPWWPLDPAVLDTWLEHVLTTERR